jgi:hypothetical protein
MRSSSTAKPEFPLVIFLKPENSPGSGSTGLATAGVIRKGLSGWTISTHDAK